MRIAQVVATVDEATAGPSHSVRRLSEHLDRAGEEVRLHTVEGWRAEAAKGPPWLERHAQDFRRTPGLNRLCLSGDLLAALKAEAGIAQVIHTHGLWLMPNIYPAQAAAGSACATVISPRGMLGRAALDFSPFKKRLVWGLWQRAAVDKASCLHATGEQELQEIRAFGIDRPVAVIPNGVDIPEAAPRPAKPIRTVLALGRLHPKKGLPNLVRAWAQMEAMFPDWRLRIVGPSEGGHGEELAALASSLKLDRVAIDGPLTGEAKLAAYREADLFVLPTLNENFALTVAESLAAGAPVIATKGAPWDGLVRERCGWWIDIGVEPLAAALQVAMSLPDGERTAMGQRGRDWMARDFGWAGVARQMIEVYGWLSGGGDRPAQVHLA